RALWTRVSPLAPRPGLSVGAAAPAAAAHDRWLVTRDAAIEAPSRAYATPIFQAAGLVPDDIQIALVQNDRINAYVTHGLNLVLYTGLLVRSEAAGQVIGVIAHETGHIAGGHLARGREEIDTVLLKALAIAALGIGAAIASGRPDAAPVIMGAGMDMLQRDLMRYSRTQESAADHAGVGFLDATGQSSRGLLRFLEIM